MSAAALLPLVYEELRRLAAMRVQGEGHAASLRATSLVHAVYLRLIGESAEQEAIWNGRGHFFAAAALAMRRILVERARQRRRRRRGGDRERLDAAVMDGLPAAQPEHDSVDMLALDDALKALEAGNRDLYRVVMLRYFGGLSIDDTASELQVSVNTVKRRWNVARLWLLDRIEGCARTPGEDPMPRID